MGQDLSKISQEPLLSFPAKPDWEVKLNYDTLRGIDEKAFSEFKRTVVQS